jgi:hypothetical protein
MALSDFLSYLNPSYLGNQAYFGNQGYLGQPNYFNPGAAFGSYLGFGSDLNALVPDQQRLNDAIAQFERHYIHGEEGDSGNPVRSFDTIDERNKRLIVAAAVSDPNSLAGAIYRDYVRLGGTYTNPGFSSNLYGISPNWFNSSGQGSAFGQSNPFLNNFGLNNANPWPYNSAIATVPVSQAQLNQDIQRVSSLRRNPSDPNYQAALAQLQQDQALLANPAAFTSSAATTGLQNPLSAFGSSFWQNPFLAYGLQGLGSPTGLTAIRNNTGPFWQNPWSAFNSQRFLGPPPTPIAWA